MRRIDLLSKLSAPVRLRQPSSLMIAFCVRFDQYDRIPIYDPRPSLHSDRNAHYRIHLDTSRISQIPCFIKLKFEYDRIRDEE